MKGTSKVMMGATLSIVMILAIVLGLVLILLAELYCSILLRRRKLRSSTKPDDQQPQTLQSYSTTPSPLTSFYCHGVLEAPRSFLFPNLNQDIIDVEKQKHAKLHQFLRVQSPLFHVGIAASTSSPSLSSTLVSSSPPKRSRRKKLPEICPEEEEEEGCGDDHIDGMGLGGIGGPPWPEEEEEEGYGDDHFDGTSGQGGMGGPPWPKPHKEKHPEIGSEEEEEEEGYGDDHIDGMGQGGPSWPKEEEQEEEGDDIDGMTNTSKSGPPWPEGRYCWNSPINKMCHVEKAKEKDMNRDDGDDNDGGLGGPPWSEDEEGGEGDSIDGTGGSPWPKPGRKNRHGARPMAGGEIGPGVMYISNPIYEDGEVARAGDTPAFGTPESSPSRLDGGGVSGGGSSGDDEREEEEASSSPGSADPGSVPLTPMNKLPPPRCSTTKGKKSFRVALRTNARSLGPSVSGESNSHIAKSSSSSSDSPRTSPSW